MGLKQGFLSLKESVDQFQGICELGWGKITGLFSLTSNGNLALPPLKALF